MLQPFVKPQKLLKNMTTVLQIYSRGILFVKKKTAAAAFKNNTD
jgi:hypothetical protein